MYMKNYGKNRVFLLGLWQGTKMIKLSSHTAPIIERFKSTNKQITIQILKLQLVLNPKPLIKEVE